MSHQRTVYVIDGKISSRRALTLELAKIGAEAWPFGSGSEFVEICSHLMPGIILLDVDAADGLSLLETLIERQTSWPVLAMSAGGQVSVAVAAMKLGAIDFLERPLDAATLAAALAPAWQALETSVRDGEARRAAQDRLGRLTARELDISAALFAGHSNKTVAHELGISVRTVEMHRAHIMAKLGVRSIAEAAVMATQAGLPLQPSTRALPAERRNVVGFARPVPDFRSGRLAGSAV
ncbi:MAG TPA: LuxR C-terminal-related transcriptional regulator [Allosphingosinicella sp.]|nr:LuxR C-terminal-related transcriptional regulator [Allosphingosinicella sp.]